MSSETTYWLPTRVGADGVHHAETFFTPVDDKARPLCVVPPPVVIPVVFVPGVMEGLKAKEDIWLDRQRVFKERCPRLECR